MVKGGGRAKGGRGKQPPKKKKKKQDSDGDIDIDLDAFVPSGGGGGGGGKPPKSAASKLNDAADSAQRCTLYALMAVGVVGAILAIIGAGSCEFLDVNKGEVDGTEFEGRAGLLRWGEGSSSCSFYESSFVNDEVNLQIAVISAWGATLCAISGVIFSFIHAKCLPAMDCCVIMFFGSSIIFAALSFFIHSSSLCGDCSISTGSYYMMGSIPFCAVPASLILFMPRPIPQWGKDAAGQFAGDDAEMLADFM